jgi:flagellar motor switch protein FliN
MTTQDLATSTDVETLTSDLSFENDIASHEGFAGQDPTHQDVSNIAGGTVCDVSGDHSPTGALLQIPISVQVVLGGTTMALSKVMALGPGSIISLDQQLSDSVLMLVNGKEFARGTIVVIDETNGQLGISLTDIVPLSQTLKKVG